MGGGAFPATHLFLNGSQVSNVFNPLGIDGRALPFIRPDQPLDPFPDTLTNAAALTTDHIYGASVIFVWLNQFPGYINISPEGTAAAAATSLGLEAGKLYTFAIMPGDRVSLLGTDVTGDTAQVWAATPANGVRVSLVAP